MEIVTVDDIQNMSMQEYAVFRQAAFTSGMIFSQETGTNSYAYHRQQYIDYGNENDFERMLEHVETDSAPGC